MTSKTISCEFFPPRTDKGVQNLRKTCEQLQILAPAYFSVTFGAGGSTQAKTFETVVEIQQSGTEAAPHLSCIGSTRENIRKLLQEGRIQEAQELLNQMLAAYEQQQQQMNQSINQYYESQFSEIRKHLQQMANQVQQAKQHETQVQSLLRPHQRASELPESIQASCP